MIHESGYEWLRNAVADRADMWISPGRTTYLECLYVEWRWGHPDEAQYVNALKGKVRTPRRSWACGGRTGSRPQNMYYKGALLLNTLRSMVGDDAVWFGAIREFYERFKYPTILTEHVVAFFSGWLEMELTPV